MKRSPSSVFHVPASVPAKRAPSVFRFPSSVLIAVTGMSPAILTETAWALANGKPRLLPGKVVVFATARSRDQIHRELLESGAWEDLRRAVRASDDELIFGKAGDHIRVFSRRGRELDDLRTPEDNQAAADFMLEHLRQFTENPDLRIVASIAGGRKTMGALLYAAMTLIGRETDRITHVLVDERLEQQRDPKFYFPKTPSEEKGIHLADIPFVPLRNKFQDLGRMPGGFSSMVTAYARQMHRGEVARVKWLNSAVEIDGIRVPLTRRLLHTLAFLMELNRSKDVPEQATAESRFKAFLARHDPVWASQLVYPDDLKRALSDLRKRLTAANLTWMPGLRRHSLRLPPFETEDGKQEDGII